MSAYTVHALVSVSAEGETDEASIEVDTLADALGRIADLANARPDFRAITLLHVEDWPLIMEGSTEANPAQLVARPEDYEPRTYGEPDDEARFSHTLAAVGPARVIFDVLHPDRKGGWGFAIKEHDEQAVAIAAALTEAGYLPAPPS